MIPNRATSSRKKPYCHRLLHAIATRTVGVFYTETLVRLLASNDISTDDRVLVVCGGPTDADVLSELGFGRVLITNLDPSYDDEIDAYPCSRADAEDLAFRDDEFDLVVVHAGLHHCGSPHRALLEMYRVASKAAIVFEARESLLMRLAVRLGFTSDFELEAVTSQGLESGGLRNGPIPNHNYRWTEREVTKVMRAADPAHVERIRFFYGLRLPTLRFDNVDAPFRRLVLKAVAPAVKVLVSLFPTQGNEFGFVIFKTGQLRDWLELRDGRLRVSREKANERGQAYTLDKRHKAAAAKQKSKQPSKQPSKEPSDA
jgi:SAM-dependent methyltransferase